MMRLSKSFRPNMRALFGAAILVWSCNAAADEAGTSLSFNGMIDLRAVATDSLRGFEDGGAGLTRYGGTGANKARYDLRVPIAAGIVRLQFNSEFSLENHLRLDPDRRSKLDVIESFFRYAPASVDRTAYRIRAGAFLPSMTLEDSAVAWTSPYTLTPSAISSWLGDEIRALGVEGQVLWRGRDDTVDLRVGTFGGNHPAGAAIAARGFVLTDRLFGLFDPRVRVPAGMVNELRHLDQSYGVYAGLAYRSGDAGGAKVFVYDNLADPRRVKDGFAAWRTRFVIAGFDTQPIEDVTILVQAMTGTTRIQPVPAILVDLRYESISALLAKDFGPHRISLRAEEFRVSDLNRFRVPGRDQHGGALTASYVTWLDRSLRWTLEGLYVKSDSSARALIGAAPRQSQTQVQTSLRYYFRP